MTQSAPMVRTEALTKEIASPEGMLTLVANITVSIAAGEAVAIVGVSGAGKSTLLGLLAGLDRPTRGRVWLDGHDLTDLDEDGRARLRAARVGFVFQSFQLLPSLTAIENVMLPLELAGRASAHADALAALAHVGLRERARHYPRQLSGGEQQRVAIARAFGIRPRVLFADEPTGNLDQGTGARVIDLMLSLRQESGTTLIMVTHDPALANRCDRTLTLDAGRLVA